MDIAITIANWIVVPIGDGVCIYGYDTLMDAHVVTNLISEMDGATPPTWATTKSGTRYSLMDRDSRVNQYSSKAISDTLEKRGLSKDEIAKAIMLADRINKEWSS